MPQTKFEPRRSLVAFDQHRAVVCAVELSLESWLVGGIVPGIAREPEKKLATPDPEALLRLLYRWRDEAAKAGETITRIVVAYEAGRDGFWLARWLRTRGIEVYVIRRALPSHGSIGVRRAIELISRCSSAPSSAGYVARKST